MIMHQNDQHNSIEPRKYKWTKEWFGESTPHFRVSRSSRQHHAAERLMLTDEHGELEPQSKLLYVIAL